MPTFNKLKTLLKKTEVVHLNKLVIYSNIISSSSSTPWRTPIWRSEASLRRSSPTSARSCAPASTQWTNYSPLSSWVWQPTRLTLRAAQSDLWSSQLNKTLFWIPTTSTTSTKKTWCLLQTMASKISCKKPHALWLSSSRMEVLHMSLRDLCYSS